MGLGVGEINFSKIHKGISQLHNDSKYAQAQWLVIKELTKSSPY